MTSDGKELECQSCKLALRLGDENVIGVQVGVIGERGFIRLQGDDWTLFHCEECLIEYFGGDSAIPERLP